MAKTLKQDVKLACGHRVKTEVDSTSDVAWCPKCKRDLFTGWPEHMEEYARFSERLKVQINKYLDECIQTGGEPTLTEIVKVCEPLILGMCFSKGRSFGSAVDDD